MEVSGASLDDTKEPSESEASLDDSKDPSYTPSVVSSSHLVFEDDNESVTSKVSTDIGNLSSVTSASFNPLDVTKNLEELFREGSAVPDGPSALHHKPDTSRPEAEVEICDTPEPKSPAAIGVIIPKLLPRTKPKGAMLVQIEKADAEAMKRLYQAARVKACNINVPSRMGNTSGEGPQSKVNARSKKSPAKPPSTTVNAESNKVSKVNQVGDRSMRTKHAPPKYVDLIAYSVGPFDPAAAKVGADELAPFHLLSWTTFCKLISETTKAEGLMFSYKIAQSLTDMVRGVELPLRYSKTSTYTIRLFVKIEGGKIKLLHCQLPD